MSQIGLSVVGAFLIAILTFVLGTLMTTIQDERRRVDEILKLQASVLAKLEDHIADHND